MKNIPYVSDVGSIIYAQVCIRPDIDLLLEYWENIIVMQVWTTKELQRRY